MRRHILFAANFLDMSFFVKNNFTVPVKQTPPHTPLYCDTNLTQFDKNFAHQSTKFFSLCHATIDVPIHRLCLDETVSDYDFSILLTYYTFVTQHK